MKPSKTKWNQVNPSDTKWKPNETKWNQSETKRDRLKPSDAKWDHVKPSETMWDLPSPSEWSETSLPHPLPPILLSSFSWLYGYDNVGTCRIIVGSYWFLYSFVYGFNISMYFHTFSYISIKPAKAGQEDWGEGVGKGGLTSLTWGREVSHCLTWFHV